MPYVYVKDSEGFVFKKKESEVTTGEKIISEKEYMKKIRARLIRKVIRTWGRSLNFATLTSLALKAN